MKKVLSVLLLVCMFAACAASSVVYAEVKTPDNPSRLTFNDTAKTYFSSPNNTTVSIVEDDSESGCSVLLEVKSPFTDPFVQFNYKSYLTKLGIASGAPKADDVKYVILKIKQEFCSNYIFEIFYMAGNMYGAAPGYSVVSTFDESNEDWQYVVFNMTGATGWTGAINAFRFDWMMNGTSAGEKMYINELILAKDEAEMKEYVKPAESSGVDLHALTAKQQRMAEYLLENAVEAAPAVSNEKINAEYEDESLVMWFDHSYYKTPGEVVTSNGQNTYQIRLAKNEIECAQMVLASETAREGLTVEVSDFVNGDAKLTPTLYYGYYFDDVEGQSIVDPIPELQGPIDLTANKSQLFLIKVKSTKNTPAGQYTATLTVKDKDGKEIKKANVYAYVWDFALPDASNVKTLGDLGWWSIYAADPQLYSGDDGLGYKYYYDLLLENKFNAYNMPYVDEAEYNNRAVISAYLDDPRVQAFNPIGFSKAPTTENITRAYNFLSQKEEWLEKAYFYTVDEPMDKAKLDTVRNHANLIKSIWGDNYKLITPMHWNSLYDREYKLDAFEYVKGYVNVWCPHTFFFNTYADKQANPLLTYRCYKKVEENLGTFPERMAEEQEKGNEVWWYVTRYPHYPEITLSISDPAVDHRIMFWQQKLYNVDGFLYYSVNDWYGGGSSQHDWGWNAKKEVSTDSFTPYTVYGNGVLLYHGGKVGRLHEAVESIRLEQIRDGIEDYDYFVLLDEKYGEGTSDLLIKQVTTSLGNFKSDIDLFTEVRLAAGNLIAGELLEVPQGTAGDVNCDGSVNNKDVVALFKHVSGVEIEVDETACDCNGDGKANNKDVTVLFKYCSGIAVQLYYGKKEIEVPDITLSYVPATVYADEKTASANGLTVPGNSRLCDWYAESANFDEDWNVIAPDEFGLIDEYVIRSAIGKYIEEVNVFKVGKASDVEAVKAMARFHCDKQEDNQDYRLYDDENKTNEKMIGTGTVAAFGNYVIYAVTQNTEVSMLRAEKFISENPGSSAYDVYRAIVCEL